MCYTGLFRRIIPFALTFAVGLLVASLFVPIALPGAGWRPNRANRFHEMQRLRTENDQLREKLRQARTENEALRQSAGDMDFVIPEVDTPSDWELDAHHPPPPPKKPKPGRTDTLR